MGCASVAGARTVCSACCVIGMPAVVAPLSRPPAVGTHPFCLRAEQELQRVFDKADFRRLEVRGDAVLP